MAKITKDDLESHNNANITALKDVISRGEGYMMPLFAHDGGKHYRLTGEDIQRAKGTIANLSRPITEDDVNIVNGRTWR